jgi:galactose mutarotase-like enzyme
MDHTTISNSNITATIKLHGAELCSLRTPDNRELIWQADPHVWPRHAPILFPIVGRLKDDQLRHHGKFYSMTQHGFARDTEFELAYRDETRVEFHLASNEHTLARFPFVFDLTVCYTLSKNRLLVDYFVRNPAAEDMPLSIGTHTAFVWPLRDDVAKHEHSIEFEHDETTALRRLQNGLLSPQLLPSPIRNRELELKENLFDHDALIWLDINSRKMTYRAADKMSVTVEFEHFPHLGIWSKPGADFVCLEPWQGYASPLDFEGEFADKPGVTTVPGYSERLWRHVIEVNT